jgi:hypothetical protein
MLDSRLPMRVISCPCTVLDAYMMVLMPDMSSTAFIEALPVIEFVAQILGKDVMSRPLSDANRIKVNCAVDGEQGIWHSAAVWHVPAAICLLLLVIGLLACPSDCHSLPNKGFFSLPVIC